MVQQTPLKKQSNSLALLIVCGLVCFLAATNLSFADQDLAREPLSASWKSDAELTDVYFLDANLGWAVGAQGVILRTTNGGKDWREISQAPEHVADTLSLQQKLLNMRTGTQTSSTGLANGSSQSQQLPVRCRFESICFINATHGWVAGGYDVPYVDRSRAVVLRTQDGGQTWESIRSLVIPRISKIHFDDQLNGWAVGRTGNLFQAGVYYTANGGQTWSSKSSEKMVGWTDAVKSSLGILAIDHDGKPGVLGSNGHEFSVIRQKGLKKIDQMKNDQMEFDQMRINQVAMSDARQGWAAGEQGTMLKTIDGGQSFMPIGLDSANAAQINRRIAASAVQFDLKTVAVTSKKVWFAGDPGTLLFAVDRETSQAIARRLPIQTRINKLHFSDDQNGWAVGALGCILSTNDGGETWALQRGKSQTAAMLVINASPDSTGFELFSKYASQDNHLCAWALMGSNLEEYQSLSQATDRLGGSTSHLIDSRDSDEALKNLVRLIRCLQPRLIVLNAQTPNTNRSQSNQASQKIQIMVNEAIELAADRAAYGQQIVDAGLKPWQVSRLATRDSVGEVNIDSRQLLPGLGMLIEDQIAVSRAMTGQSVVPKQTLSYRVTELTRNGAVKAGDLLSGLGHISNNLNTKRSESNERHGNLTAIHQASAKQRTFAQFLKFESTTAQDFLVWRQQVQSFAMKMESDIAGVWLMQLAERYIAAGKPELAAASAELLVKRWAEHAFAPAALSWLANYYGSDEFGQIEFLKRVQSGQIGRGLKQGSDAADQTDVAAVNTGKDFQTTSQVVQTGGVSQLVWAPVKVLEAAELKKASNDQASDQTIDDAKQTFFAARHQRAGTLLKQLGRRDPELIASTQYKFFEAQLARQISGKITNESRWENLASNLAQQRDDSGVGVSIGAQRELALGGFESADRRAIENALSCLATSRRPKLDGKLNDSCWQSVIQTGNAISATANLVPVAGQAQPNQDITLMAFDDKFLYLGVVCQKVEGHYYNLRKSARTRDSDVSRRDRIEFVIDTNRDYRTAFKFVVDHRGWPNDSCAGSLGWDPQWYVAQSEDESTWTVEVAIPLEQIAARNPDGNTTWALALKRKVFDDRNVWEHETKSVQSTSDAPELSGLQVGLAANPADFTLIRFVQRQPGRTGQPMGANFEQTSSPKPPTSQSRAQYISRRPPSVPTGLGRR